MNKAILITGPQGSGKTGLARVLAEVVGCDNPGIRTTDARHMDACRFNEYLNTDVLIVEECGEGFDWARAKRLITSNTVEVHEPEPMMYPRTVDTPALIFIAEEVPEALLHEHERHFIIIRLARGAV